MTTELQQLIDAVAERVGRPAVLEDRRQRMIVYSQHDDPLDPVRSDSILRRRASPDVVAWFQRFSLAEATGPVRTPAAPDLAMLARVCIPIRHRDLLLGFLWFVDADGSMTEREVERASATTPEFALALYRENLAEELAMHREAEAVRNLLIAETAVQAHAARELIEGGQFQQSAGVLALVVTPVTCTEPSEVLRLAIEQALVDTRRRLGPHRALGLVRYDHGLLLLATLADAIEPPDAATLLRSALVRAVRALPEVDRVIVGIGSPQPSLDGARRSYDAARQATDVALHLPAAGPVADWSDLGIYRTLVQLSVDQLEAASIHPGLDRLLDDPDAGTLLDTLETYLDLAGNAQAASRQLRVHRTSLYYRLQRIEELAGTDLKDGKERLALHLALTVARLSGKR